nr:hypothetical protein [Paracoccus mutanolyticus]
MGSISQQPVFLPVLRREIMAAVNLHPANFYLRDQKAREDDSTSDSGQGQEREGRRRGQGGRPFVIDVMDVIGESWDGYGITGRRVGALLRAAGEREVVVNINSPGGDVFEGRLLWPYLYPYPQWPEGLVEEGFDELARRWHAALLRDLSGRFALFVTTSLARLVSSRCWIALGPKAVNSG